MITRMIAGSFFCCDSSFSVLHRHMKPCHALRIWMDTAHIVARCCHHRPSGDRCCSLHKCSKSRLTFLFNQVPTLGLVDYLCFNQVSTWVELCHIVIVTSNASSSTPESQPHESPRSYLALRDDLDLPTITSSRATYTIRVHDANAATSLRGEQLNITCYCIEHWPDETSSESLKPLHGSE